MNKKISMFTFFTLLFAVSAAYSLEQFTVEDMHREVQQSAEAAKQKAEKEEKERKETQENQQKTFEQATREFYRTGSLK